MDFCLIVVCAFIYFNCLWNENKVLYIEVHHVIIYNIFTKAYMSFEKGSMWREKNMSCEKIMLCENMFNSVQSLSHVGLFATPWTAAHQASLSITNSRACSDSYPSSWLCHPTISSSVVPFSSCLQSFPASGSFPVSQFFALGGQNIGASTSASVLPMNTQDWFPLGLTGLISLQPKGLSRVFSNTTVQKHQFFCASIHQNHKFWRNNSRKNDGTEPRQKQCPVVDVTGDGCEVWCCKEQHCIGTWKVRP